MRKADPEPALMLPLPMAEIAGFCRRWKITTLEVFGSILRDDFGSESDVDFLVTFDPDAQLSLFDLFDAEEELARIVGRSVDLVERGPIEKSKNWMRRRMILGSAQTIYVG
ncbi:MAG: nucleotidyltransferase domain-containing protein [Planctomycetes bacterium]|nr:nucleotidyltransferase domain-containing protein [Planctomycetota bacterium]